MKNNKTKYLKMRTTKPNELTHKKKQKRGKGKSSDDIIKCLLP